MNAKKPTPSPNTPPSAEDDRRLVYESEDNPVIRARGLEAAMHDQDSKNFKQFLQVKLGMLVIFILLFVPQDKRVKVVDHLPNAVLVPVDLVADLIHRLF